ncbi:MAG TPA: N-acetylglucosamine-6-phosphate deacetylase [bacterium]|nr:N-acetylglucosamine-6-phosphate deacetylase [bacterium]HPR88965.1 N-acetylglucosamine-6-phosphate deacetylase [bacterium]
MSSRFDLILKDVRLLERSAATDIAIRAGRIAAIGRMPGDARRILDAGGLRVVPGFIDLHIQGAGGADVLDGTPEALETMSRCLARLGTTGFLATSVIFPEGENRHLRLAAEAMGKNLGGAQLLGIHLEGPYINPLRKGGLEPRCIFAPAVCSLDAVLKSCGGALKMMTLAPELPGGLDLIRALRDNGIIPALGHTDASLDQARAGLDAGIPHVTHIFNAMPGLNHRTPGPLLAIFEHAEVTAQIISDGVHVHPGMVRLLSRLIGVERCVPITDGMQAIGLPEGRYLYNGREYESAGGAARYHDGTLIGSALGLAEVTWRFQRFTGCAASRAVAAATHQAAKVIGLGERKGRIAPGYDADLVILQDDASVALTLIGGEVVWQN